jgi:protein-disulfide isomerase
MDIKCGSGLSKVARQWVHGLAWAAVVVFAHGGCQSNPPVNPNPSAQVPVASDVSEAPRPEAPRPEAPKPVSLPAGLDTKDLDEAEKQVLKEVLDEQFDPCGKSRSFFESLSDASTCEQAKTLAALAVERIAKGLSKKQVIQELLKEQARWASKQEFDLTGSPSHGEPGPDKKVVVEFFDYQCPHCKEVSKPTKELVTKYGAVLYYKMLPLDHHPAAKDAALIALAAQRQGCFHALHERFFEHQEELSPEKNRELAKAAGCDMARLDNDLKDTAEGSAGKLLERDLKESNEAKIQGTPTFFVDGFEVEHDQLEEALKK